MSGRQMFVHPLKLPDALCRAHQSPSDTGLQLLRDTQRQVKCIQAFGPFGLSILLNAEQPY